MKCGACRFFSVDLECQGRSSSRLTLWGEGLLSLMLRRILHPERRRLRSTAQPRLFFARRTDSESWQYIAAGGRNQWGRKSGAGHVTVLTTTGPLHRHVAGELVPLFESANPIVDWVGYAQPHFFFAEKKVLPVCVQKEGRRCLHWCR